MRKCKLVLIGAGSASFTIRLVADMLESATVDEWVIGLVDIDEHGLEVGQGVVERLLEERESAVSIEASTDRCDLLSGADVVVSTIHVGGRAAWMKDFRIPEKYGVLQPIGDTVMAGGISRALRQIPAMLEIAADVHRLCPDALFFNYANPMTAICRAVNRAGSKPIVGLCHGIPGTIQYLCGLIDVPPNEVSALYMGVNHMTWITHITRGGEDLWPRIEAAAANSADDDNLFCWDLYRVYGAFPAALEPHVIEFYPEYFPNGDYYSKRWGEDVLYCPDFMIESGNEEAEKMAAIAAGEAPLDSSQFGRRRGIAEALVPILDSVFTDGCDVFPMNVPNTTVKGIPEGLVLEMPVLASSAGCLPVSLPPMPPGLLGTVSETLHGIEITVEAALQGDRDLVVQALFHDKCVTSRKMAEALADELLHAHREHLPQFA